MAGGGANGLCAGPAGIHSAETSLSATPGSCRPCSAAHSAGPGAGDCAAVGDPAEAARNARNPTVLIIVSGTYYGPAAAKGAAGSVLHRTLDAVDQEDVDRADGWFELQRKLFHDGREQPRCIASHHVRHAVVGGPRELQVVDAR